MASDAVLQIAKWRARLPRVRATIKTLTGIDTAPPGTEPIIQDSVLASMVARSETVADLATGDAPEYTKEDCRGIALAAAVSLAAEAVVQARAIMEASQWARFDAKMAEAAARAGALFEHNMLSPGGKKPGGGETVN